MWHALALCLLQRASSNGQNNRISSRVLDDIVKRPGKVAALQEVNSVLEFSQRSLASREDHENKCAGLP